MVTLFNSLSRKQEKFRPQEAPKVKMYACGVTVYDRCHIGHARSLYLFEVVRRYLSRRGYEVRFVRNITDIDDKIIQRAQERRQAWDVVVEENIRAYQEDLKRLGLSHADEEPRATHHIPAMIRHIEGLIEKEKAYVSEGNVYFHVRAFPAYGRLSHQSLDRMREAVRIEKDPNKKDPLDFALWKKAREGEPFWESPWGPGRPGWHIECSCMSLGCLKTATLDIHAGGKDLIFPHHENEIAQSEALTGQPFARYWIHHGLLTINGHKMAKSLGNFVTIEKAVEQFGASALKYFFLTAHYRSDIDFSEERMIEARKALERFQILFQKVDGDGRSGGESVSGFVSSFAKRWQEAMDDDFNTPAALAVMFDLLSAVNTRLQKTSSQAREEARAGARLLREWGRNVFLIFDSTPNEIDLPLEAQELLEARAEARAAKDFQKSDALREQLFKEYGLIIEDTREGQSWRQA